MQEQNEIISRHRSELRTCQERADAVVKEKLEQMKTGKSFLLSGQGDVK